MKVKTLFALAILLCWGHLAAAADKVFVAETFANQVDRLDLAAGAAGVSPIAVGLMPQDIVLSAKGDALYVANYSSHDLTEVDPQTLAVRRTIELSCSPSALALAADGTTGYALCRNTGRLLFLDLAGGTETGALAIVFPYGLAVAPDGQRAYVSRSMFSRYVDVVDLGQRKVLTTITVGRSPQGIVVGPSGLSVYTANAGSGSISVIDALSNRVRATVAVGSGPVALAVDGKEEFLFVANKNEAVVSVVDLQAGRAVAKIPVGVSPQALALSADTAMLYVANFGSNTLSVIDTETWQVTRTIPVGNGPVALAVQTPTDTTPPVVTLEVSDAILWPPNHKLVPISVHLVVSDDQDPNPTVQLLDISSNEPCSGNQTGAGSAQANGADPTSCDDIADAAIGTADRSFRLRAERFGYGEEGRIYTIRYQVTDAAGNATVATTSVRVPLNVAEARP